MKSFSAVIVFFLALMFAGPVLAALKCHLVAAAAFGVADPSRLPRGAGCASSTQHCNG